MSTLPSYSLIGPSGPFTTLPGHYRYGGENKSKSDTNISFETDSGVEFFYAQFTRHIFELHFLIGETDLQAFQALHNAVGGTIPFWFRLNLPSEGLNPATYFVMKEAEFRPEEEEPGEEYPNIGPEPFYSYVLRLRERLT